MKNKKGITLIALVITVIIMLILVVVTIDFSTDGGLISKSREAVDVTNSELGRDELLQYITKEFNLTTNTVNLEKLAERLAKSENWTDTKVLEKYLLVTNSQTGETYKIDINGEISNPKNLTDLEKFLLGEDGQGKNLNEIFSGSIEDGIINPYSSESSKVYLKTVWSEHLDEDGNEFFTGIFKYEDKLYTLKAKYNEADESITSLPDPGLKLGFEKNENSRVGEYVLYKGGMYVIIYDDEIHGTQMINVCINLLSMEPANYIDIGPNDTSVEDWTKQEIIDEVDFDNSGDLDYKEKTVYSYNHAVETLNNSIKPYLINKVFGGPIDENVVKDARCLGTNPTYPYVTQSSKYTSDLLKNTNFNGKLLSGNNTAMQDYMQLLGLDLITLYKGAPYKQPYWYASRHTYIDDRGDIRFDVNESTDQDSVALSSRTILSISKKDNYQNIIVDNIYHSNMPAYPVIILQDGILDKVIKAEKDGVVAYNLLELYE